MITSNNNCARFYSLIAAFLLSLFLAGCGGGGGSGSSSNTTGATTGSGTSTGTGSTGTGSTAGPTTCPGTTSSASNVIPVCVDGNVFGAANSPFVTITICNPTSTSNCMTIDHILLDTGSVGLRVFNQPANLTAALSSLNLSTLKVQNGSAAAQPILECLGFAQGVTWGPIKNADVTLGSTTLSNMALQVIADPNYVIPDVCTSQGKSMQTTTLFGANGVLGIGLTAQDCGVYCTDANYQAGVYYTCPTTTTCSNVGVPLAYQLQHPATLFTTNNNGTILTMNSVSDSGASYVAGTLTFGIDTASNNVSANTHTLLVDNNGYVTTQLEGQSFPGSFLDSGSNGYFFNPSTSITACTGSSGFYCPTSTQTFTATISGSAGSSAAATVNFNVANANTLFSNTSFVAFNNLAGAGSTVPPGNLASFDWGLSFFYGKTVYTAIENATTTKGAGPYFGW